MSDPEVKPRPERITGVAHFFAAAGYSIAGIRRLWQETAFRHEVLAFVLVIAGLFWLGASFAEMGVMVVLFFALVAMEALNTAIECLHCHKGKE